MSGCGVWEVPIGSKNRDTIINIGRPILRGISFRQETDKGAFYAHELESISDHVLEWLDQQ